MVIIEGKIDKNCGIKYKKDEKNASLKIPVVFNVDEEFYQEQICKFELVKNKDKIIKKLIIGSEKIKPYTYVLPGGIIKNIYKLKNCSNLNLKFNKYMKRPDIDNQKFKLAQNISKYKVYEENIINDKIKKFYQSLKKLNLNFVDEDGFDLTLETPLAIGLGIKSTFETSISLHHIYGIPYIPGSALKGVCRSYFLEQIIENYSINWEDISALEKILESIEFQNKDGEKYFEEILGNNGEIDEKKFKKFFNLNENNKDGDKINIDLLLKFLNKNIDIVKTFQSVFGTQNKQGDFIFFDMFPFKSDEVDFNLKVDVMTPHYNEYYNSSKPPSDNQKPIPIPFLTVDKGATFKCFVAYKKGKDNQKNNLSKLNEKFTSFKCFIKKVLSENGIGAKTSVGYGYFKE